ncbi:hypothetical protein AAVH_27006 [Aphelenchoides avenae]|nr:hypothetical protein AAVH_27006 [Aphelenchus avenae]
MFFATGFSVLSVVLASPLKDDGHSKNITVLGNPKCDRVYNVNTSNRWFDVQLIQPDGRVVAKERVQEAHGMGITVSYHTPGGMPYLLMSGECHGPKTKRFELGNCTVRIRYEFHNCTVLSGGQLDLGEMYLD